MKNLKRGLSLILSLAMLLGCFSGGMVALADSYKISGTVLAGNTGATIEGIEVSLWAESNTTQMADADLTLTDAGAYEFTNLDIGKYTIKIAASNEYDAVEEEVAITDSDVEKDITLTKSGGITEPTIYTITFSANGGSGSMDEVTDATSPYTLPACTFTAPTGQKFKGWATTADGAVITTTTFTITADTTLYAIWEDTTAEKPDFDHGIVTDSASYTINSASVTPDAKVPDTVGARAYQVADFYIDLAAEKIYMPLGVDIKAYSTDGGGKWKVGALKNGDDISKLLDKGMTLWLTTAYDAKAKAPTEGVVAVPKVGDTPEVKEVKGATVIKFAEIAERPKADKLTVNYALAAGTDPDKGQWVLVEKSDLETKYSKLSTLQIAPSKDGKKADTDWGKFPSTGGINVKPLSGTKAEKLTYLVRVAPVATGTFAPASKPFKVSVSGQIVAPKLKPDYKKEIIKPKAGVVLQAGNGTAITYTKDDKDAIKAGFGITSAITNGVEVNAWTAATVKKPASAMQEITLVARDTLSNGSLAVSSGKLKLDKKYEVYDSSKEKWGGMPKVESSGTFDIRLKTTAKVGKTSTSGKAASATGTLTITWGDLPTTGDKPAKQGILTAVITGGTSVTPDIDTSSIDTAITAANTAKAGVKISADGADVPTTEFWVTQAVMTTLEEAISTATAAKGTVKSTAEAQTAAATLDTAVTTFTNAKQAGTKQTVTTYTVSGTVSAGTTNADIAGITVELWNTEAKVTDATTDEDGKYEFTGVANGNYKVKIAASAEVGKEYDAVEKAVIVNSDNATADITLEHSVV